MPKGGPGEPPDKSDPRTPKVSDNIANLQATTLTMDPSGVAPEPSREPSGSLGVEFSLADAEKTIESTTSSSSNIKRKSHPTLHPKTPVPSDIEVSQQIVSEVGLLPIADVATEAGLLSDEVIPWGIAKAKVRANYF